MKLHEEVIPLPTGTLVATSAPTNASVSVDGTYVGQTPATPGTLNGTLSMGKHTVLMTKPGFADCVKTVDVVADRANPVQGELKSQVAFKTARNFAYLPDKTNLHCVSIPYGAKFTKASGIVAALEPEGGNSKISMVAKWDPSGQTTAGYGYFPGFGWLGDDFALSPGDGVYLYLSGNSPGFDWEPEFIFLFPLPAPAVLLCFAPSGVWVACPKDRNPYPDGASAGLQERFSRQSSEQPPCPASR